MVLTEESMNLKVNQINYVLIKDEKFSKNLCKNG